MNRRRIGRIVIALASAVPAACLPGCAGPGEPAAPATADYAGLDYYEPAGVIYGGWGPRYRVGPFRDGYSAAQPRADQAGRARAYIAAPAAQPIPSIPGSASSPAR